MNSHGLITTVAGRDLTNREMGLDFGQPVKSPTGSGNLQAASAPYPNFCPKPETRVVDPPRALRSAMAKRFTGVARRAVGTGGGCSRKYIMFADRSNHRIRIRMINGSSGIFTVVGTGICGNNGDGNLGKVAAVKKPNGLSVGGKGVLYFYAPLQQSRTQIGSPAGVVGNAAGANPFDGDQAAIETLFCTPTGIAADTSGSLFVADSGNNRVRKIDKASQVTTIAGGGNDSKNEGFPRHRLRLSGPAVDPTAL